MIKVETRLLLPLLSSLEIVCVSVHVCLSNVQKRSERSPKILHLLIRSQAGESVWGYQLASGLQHISAALGDISSQVTPSCGSVACGGGFIWKSEQAIMNYSHGRRTFFFLTM